ncbi:hypothetical protein M427DRAFT_405388 [Gonapodya prolifera JEL478]|uniref:Xylanolytic transcriptional activator regulatory domain-containing protein n=1 Tax=Gonapodya prolifera (strain JEL478) TaxID=1344416 RepID=A0A139AU22_GONPJ|nr:hypothetical protein M427DRAFT_405388 [Gonapodya prolifera JEL478]|eukprot:KXS20240.1 hypothetical protein M427DRAFT_405388 [Gonapodya prolifera JEL478]
MNLAKEVDHPSSMDWIEKEERRRAWWWCWCTDSIIGMGSKSPPFLSDSQPNLFLPCRESHFNLEPPPTSPPPNRPSWVVLADPPLFLDSATLSGEDTRDEFWLLFIGMAKQCRVVLGLTIGYPPYGGSTVANEVGTMVLHEVSRRLLDTIP